MSYEAMLKDIKNMNLKKVYLCYGSEDYLKDWIVKEIKRVFVDEAFETLNYVHFDGKEVGADSIVNACETLPFMSDKKIVVVEDSPLFSSGKGGNSSDEEQIKDYLDKLNDSTSLIFIIKGESIDKRKKLVKSIKKEGMIVELNRIKGNDLNKWIEKNFRKNNKKILSNDIYYFAQAVGYLEYNSDKTLYDVENEIVKICNYVGDRQQITKDDIDNCLSKTLQNNLFKLLDAMGKKQPNIGLSVLNEMVLNNEPIQKITYMIIRQFRLLFMAKLYTEQGYAPRDVTKKLGVHPYAAEKIINQARNFSSKELEVIVAKCLEIDLNIKKGKIDNKLAVESLIIEVC
ncbi:MAG: DNA polymerase III subunit delta [Firmicutes bacterium]|nr:DNA polymerase III subunit delta [Bacillota bacterium]